MKKILMNKKFIEIIVTIIMFIILIGMFYAISQCISGNINISIGIN